MSTATSTSNVPKRKVYVVGVGMTKFEKVMIVRSRYFFDIIIYHSKFSTKMISSLGSSFSHLFCSQVNKAGIIQTWVNKPPRYTTNLSSSNSSSSVLLQMPISLTMKSNKLVSATSTATPPPANVLFTTSVSLAFQFVNHIIPINDI